MADNIPDFTVKTKQLDPAAVVEALQRRREIENQQNQQALNNYNGRMDRISAAIEAGQRMASNAVDLAAKRQALHDAQVQAAGLDKVQSVLATPVPQPPAPMAQSSMAPTGQPFPVAPSPEQTADYSAKVAQRKNDLAGALVQADRKGVSDILAKNMFGGGEKQGVPNYELKNMMVDGQLKAVSFNPRNNSFYDPATQQPITGKVEPFIQGEQTPLTDADRERLGKTADLVASGALDIAKATNPRGQDKGKLVQLLAEKYPDFDSSKSTQRVEMRKEYIKGTAAKNITAYNTVIPHSEQLFRDLDKLDNKSLRVYNTVGNFLNSEIGRPEVKAFSADLNAVINESSKAFLGQGIVTQDERKALRDEISKSDSKEQVQAVVENWMRLMASKSKILENNWNTGMPGVKAPIDFITKENRAILKKHGIDLDADQSDGVSLPDGFSYTVK